MEPETISAALPSGSTCGSSTRSSPLQAALWRLAGFQPGAGELFAEPFPDDLVSCAFRAQCAEPGIVIVGSAFAVAVLRDPAGLEVADRILPVDQSGGGQADQNLAVGAHEVAVGRVIPEVVRRYFNAGVHSLVSNAEDRFEPVGGDMVFVEAAGTHIGE